MMKLNEKKLRKILSMRSIDLLNMLLSDEIDRSFVDTLERVQRMFGHNRKRIFLSTIDSH